MKKIKTKSIAGLLLAGCVMFGSIALPIQAEEMMEVPIGEKLEAWMEQAEDTDKLEVLIGIEVTGLDTEALHQQVDKEIEDGIIAAEDEMSRYATLLFEHQERVLIDYLEKNPEIAKKVIKEVPSLPGFTLDVDKYDIQMYRKMDDITLIAATELAESEDAGTSPEANKEDGIWNCVWFGFYPQKEIKNSTLLAQASYDKNGYTVIMGDTYKRESRDGQDHYFKCEPVKWRVLESDDNEMFLFSDKNIDFRRYVDTGSGDGWTRSDIHTWLNDTFYKAAFTDERKYIITKTISDEFIGESEDNVILLSEEEATNKEYGFSGSSSEVSNTRKSENTDYAEFCAFDDKGVTELSTTWMLRDTDTISCVNGIKFVPSTPSGDFIMSKYGVRPALYVEKEAFNNCVFDAGTISADGNTEEIKAPLSVELELDDAQEMLKCALKIIPTTVGDVEVLDQNGDLTVTLEDAQAVLNIALKITES